MPIFDYSIGENRDMSITLKNVSKSYFRGKEEISIISNFSRTFEKGKIYLIKGPSGRGKTTLLSMIGLLDLPTEGEIWLDDLRVDNLKEKELCGIRREKYAFVFQDYGLLENLSVYENLLLSIQESENPVSDEKIDEILKKLNIFDRKSHKVCELSGGEKQRTSFARAMIKESEVFICDEPISSVDAENAQIILKILDEVRKNRIVLVSCHTQDMDVLCDEHIFL